MKDKPKYQRVLNFEKSLNSGTGKQWDQHQKHININNNNNKYTWIKTIALHIYIASEIESDDAKEIRALPLK